MTKDKSPFCSNGGPPWTALIFIGIGILFLLQNFGIFDFGTLWRLWPLILIIIGLAKITNKRRDERSSGIILLVIGGVFLLAHMQILHWGFIWSLWPLILVAIGVSILLRHKGGAQNRHSENGINAAAVFSGSERMITSSAFEGGNVLTVFGECKLDFGRATLATNCVLDIFTLFGGTVILVPQDWDVIIDAVPIFGGSEDSRPKVPPTSETGRHRLVIKGMILFGGLEIKPTYVR